MAKKQLDQILVIDVESTCWQGSAPAGQVSEIIEIGLCVLDVANLCRVEKRCILVRPERSTVSPFCTQLTTLTPVDVASGIPLAEACQILAREYRARRRTWASYGEYDRLQFSRDCQANEIPYPFGTRHINVKNLFAIAHALPHEVGLARALHMLDLPLEGTHHRGADDAWNVAALLAVLLGRARYSGEPS